jgi:hypothetical protein
MIEINGTNYFATPEGFIITKNWRNTGKQAILRPAKDKKGYLRVGLVINGKLCTKKIHRLIAEAFIPNPEKKPQVNHINCIKSDNRVENLEWVTPKENTEHAIKNNLFCFIDSVKSVNKIIKKGELNGNSKLTASDVLQIRKLYKPRLFTLEMLAKKFNVKRSCVKDVVLKKSWKHL